MDIFLIFAFFAGTSIGAVLSAIFLIMADRVEEITDAYAPEEDINETETGI